MTFQEKKLYHQIHPLKLATDIGATVPFPYFLWHHQVALALPFIGGSEMLALLLLSTSTGLLLAAISIPLILQKIGPNPWYGFRVKKTLDDPAVWYPVNAYAGKRLLVVGLVSSLSALLLFFVSGMDLKTYALACAGITLGGILVAVIQSVFYLRSF
jgi:hypothetical protein